MACSGIFLCERSGQMEDYTFHLLHELGQVCDHVVVLLHGEVGDDGYARIRREPAECRLIQGTAIPVAIKDLIPSISDQYDGVMIADNSCYGPFVPLSSIGERMREGGYDLWDIMPQMNLLFMSGTVLRSPLLAELLEAALAEPAGPISFHALKQRIMGCFIGRGFCCGSYLPEEALELDPVYDAYRLLSQYGCPFVKREALMQPHKDVLRINAGETPRQVLDHITGETAYNQDLIWQDLLHNYEVGDIRTALHLDYVFSTRFCMDDGGEIKKKKICLVAHINYTDLIDHCFAYIREVPEEIDIVITTKGDRNIEEIGRRIRALGRDNIRLIVPKDRGREISALLVACRDILMDYEYLGFVHDKKSNKGIPIQTVGQSFMDILWENSIKNRAYIKNVLAQFEKEPRLGLLSPPAPYMSQYATVSAVSWSGCYGVTSDLAKRFKLNCVMDENKHPFVLGTTFWCRTDALRPLLEGNLDYEDFQPEPMDMNGTISHAIERVLPYVAQSQGYYSGVMTTEEYASLYITNYQYMLNEVIRVFFQNQKNLEYADVPTREEELYLSCSKYAKVYIFGAGMMGQRCAAVIEKNPGITLAGFVVSDGRGNQKMIRSHPVYELSEMRPNDDEGIVIAMKAEFAREVMPELAARGFKNWEIFRGV